MAWTLATAAMVASAVIAAGSLTYTIASAPGTPTPPPPPLPPPPPPGVPPPPPKKAPTEAEASEGVARARRTRQRAFGLDQTILNTPSLGGGGPATGRATGPKGLGSGSIF